MTYITVDVDLDEFTDDELLEELESRGVEVLGGGGLEKVTEQAWRIWELRRNGKPCEAEIDRLISDITGRIL